MIHQNPAPVNPNTIIIQDIHPYNSILTFVLPGSQEVIEKSSGTVLIDFRNQWEVCGDSSNGVK